MRALILAAGFGTRLGSLGSERPKPMFPVCDVPLIRYGVALLRGFGITEIAVNLHHHGELIEAELGDGGAFGVRITYSREEIILGTGGGIVKLADFLTDGGRESFLVVNGKLVIDADLNQLIARHRERDAVGTMLLRETPDAQKWGAIELGEDEAVTRILEQGRAVENARLCMFTGVHILSPRLIARLPNSGESDSVRQAYIPALLDGERIEGVLHRGYFHEHSTPARYLQGNWNVLGGKAALRHPPEVLVGISEAAQVSPEARIIQPVKISAGAAIAAGAQIGPNVVVGKNAVVGSRAQLSRVVLWPGSRIDSALTDAIVTPRTVYQVEGE